MTGKPKRNLVSYLGFAAWIAYGLLGALEYWRAAACSGLVIMLAIVAYEILTRRIKIIDCTSLGFSLLAIVELATVGEGSFIHYQTMSHGQSSSHSIPFWQLSHLGLATDCCWP